MVKQINMTLKQRFKLWCFGPMHFYESPIPYDYLSPSVICCHIMTDIMNCLKVFIWESTQMSTRSINYARLYTKSWKR